MVPSTEPAESDAAQGGTECVFPPAELDRRLERLRQAMAHRRLDGLVLTAADNIFWATGRQTPGHFALQALVVRLDAEPVLLVRRLEELNARANTRIADIRTYDDDAAPAAVLADAVSSLGGAKRRIGTEMKGAGLTPAVFSQLAAMVSDLEDASSVLSEARAVKSALELEFIERAAGYADAGLEAGLAAVRAGVSENAVAAAMLGAAIEAGSEYVGMQPLVSSGPRSAVPHATWRRRTLEPGDALFLELAGCHNRYHAAILRPAWLGPVPDEARRMLDASEAALAAALETLRPGATCADVHRAAEATVARHRFATAYRKRTGYSMGIAFAPDWGEANGLSLYHGVDQPIEAGMVFHIPATLRAYGRFTVGYSETAVVTAGGHRCLSGLPRRVFEIT